MDVHLHDTSITSTLLAALNMSAYDGGDSHSSCGYHMSNTPQKGHTPSNSTGDTPIDLYGEGSLDGMVLDTLKGLESNDSEQRVADGAPNMCTTIISSPALDNQDTHHIKSNRRVRRKWTEEETNHLIRGCHIYGVGNWKKVLTDPRFHFNERSSVDLKDRFRTCFPKEYRKGTSPEETTIVSKELPVPDYADAPSIISNTSADGVKKKTKNPDTKTAHHHAEVLQKLGIDSKFPKVQRRERREFTGAEDARLLQGFTIYGASWSRIQNDPSLKLSHRRSTDLRDRFRNAYPERYTSAGFKSRPRQRPPKLGRNESLEGEETQEGSKEPKQGQLEIHDQRTDDEIFHMATSYKIAEPATILIRDVTDDASTLPIWKKAEHKSVVGAIPPKSDQSPVPGSLSNDPELDQGFDKSALEQMTVEFLAVAQAAGKADVMKWDEAAPRPIFELETTMASENGDTIPILERQPSALTTVKKRAARGFGRNPVIKRPRTQKALALKNAQKHKQNGKLQAQPLDTSATDSSSTTKPNSTLS